MAWAVEIDKGDGTKWWYTWGTETQDVGQRVLFKDKYTAECIISLCGMFRWKGYKMKPVEDKPEPPAARPRATKRKAK
jgi:hypothetical protein